MFFISKNFIWKIFKVCVDQEIGDKNCYEKFQKFSYGLEILISLVQKLKNVAINKILRFFKISSDEFKGIRICYKIYVELSDR